MPRFPKITFIPIILCASFATSALSLEQPGIRYRHSFVGLPDAGDVRELVEDASQLEALKDRPPPTIGALNRRVQEDVEKTEDILRSEGFYAARVTATTEPAADDAVVRIDVEPGPRFTLGAVTLTLSPENVRRPENLDRPLTRLIGEPARAAEVLAAEDEVIARLAASGHPFAVRERRDVEIDEERAEVREAIVIATGPLLKFGNVRVEGLDNVHADYVTDLAPWDPGEIYSSLEVEKYRRLLIETALFGSVRVEPEGADMVESDAVDMIVEVSEAPPRPLGGSIRYNTDKGIGGAVFWQHRNVLGAGERVDAQADVSELDQILHFGFIKPSFLRPLQKLTTGINLKHSDTDAFEEWSGSVSAIIDRPFWETWTARAGLSLETARLTDTERKNSTLVGVPLGVLRDTTGNLVDPTEGMRMSLLVTPYYGSFRGTAKFAVSEVEGRTYLQLSETPLLVLAGRARLGSIVGESLERVPANKRFYAGGGGSVRGYAFQAVGPLDAENKPTGGLSLAEVSGEARFRVTGSIGGAVFVDGGAVSESRLPVRSALWHWAAGFGARYYTPAGPLRLDIAFPLRRRAGVDKSFQFYVSFGQAF